jgi:dephospho-CoA kinase
MPVIAVTGGVAAGKSSVTGLFGKRGATVIDADVLARQAVEPGTPALEKIVTRFGSAVLEADGSLNRPALGSLVFSDQSAREALNAIVHPEVRKLYDRAVEKASSDPGQIIFYDVPLLQEARSTEEFDLVIVVDAPAPVRAKRLQDFRGFSEQEASNRIGSQATDEQRLALADVVLDSSGTLDETLARASTLYELISQCWPDRLTDVPALYQAQSS